MPWDIQAFLFYVCKGIFEKKIESLKFVSTIFKISDEREVPKEL